MAARSLIMVDVSNIYYCCKTKFNKRLDYKAYLDACKCYGSIESCFAYGSKMGSQADPFIHYLKCQGFTPIFKEPRIYNNQEGNEDRKADWDVGIAIDAIKLMHSYDTLILGTADSDMIPLVEFLQFNKKRVITFACNIAGDLKKVSDEWIEINKKMLEDS